MWNIFKDNNDWNEKSIIGFIAFLVMCLFAFADLITGYVGKDLVYRGKLERVVDGDTVDALIDVGFDIWVKKRIRFSGLDAWESRTRNLDEKKKGLAAKERVKDLLNIFHIS